MTTITSDPAPRPLRPYAIASAERWGFAAIAFCTALLIPSLIALSLDDRLLDGGTIWAKPIKFQTSTILFFATLLLVLPLMTAAARQSWWTRAAMAAASAAAIFEIGYITLQAARGARSHFSTATPLEQALYSAMAAGAVTMVVGAAVIGVILWLQARPTVGRGLRLGVALGFVLGAVLTVIAGFILGSGAIDGPGPWVGGDRSHESGLWLLGWSTTGGDLRVPHFFATHAMQAIPIAGLLADRVLPRRLAPAATGLAAVAWIALTALVLQQALEGRPFLGGFV